MSSDVIFYDSPTRKEIEELRHGTPADRARAHGMVVSQALRRYARVFQALHPRERLLGAAQARAAFVWIERVMREDATRSWN